jgi:hypothetical protein
MPRPCVPSVSSHLFLQLLDQKEIQPIVPQYRHTEALQTNMAVMLTVVPYIGVECRVNIMWRERRRMGRNGRETRRKEGESKKRGIKKEEPATGPHC